MKTAYLSALVLGLACSMQAQTYTLSPDSSAKPQGKADKTAPAQSQPLGFGSNILDARLARAAELALKKGDKAQALDYAQRAAQASPNQPQIWFLLGYAARLNNRLQPAVDAYNHGLRLNPSSLEGLSGLAQTYSIMGRNDEAERLLKRVIAADPRRVDDSLLLGEMDMRGGDYDAALQNFRRAEQQQANTRSELLMALTYQHLKQPDLANRYLEMARHRSPDNPEVQRTMAGYYLEMGNYAEAITSLKAIRNPRPDVKAELAYSYQLDGKPVESAKLYAQAANAVPKDLALQLSAAQAQVAVGSIDDADTFLRRAAGLDPEYYRLHAIRGEIDRLQERNVDALKEYNAVLAHLPPNPAEGPLYGIQVHMDLLDLYQNLKQPTASKEQLEIARKQIAALDESGNGRVPFLRLRALIEMHLDNLDGAGKDLKEALAINAKDPSTLQLDGDLLMKLGRAEEAIQVYGRILAMDPKNRFALTSVGYASRTAGKDQDAEKYFHRLAEAYPSLYIPYLALGDMYTAHKDFAKAEAAYTKANTLAPKNALVIAGGMNVAIEAHKFDVAGVWLSRATSEMDQEPQFLREKERYLSFTGDYQQSAAVGREAIKVLPGDRDVVVYLGYDLLNLHLEDELLQLTAHYTSLFPKEPDLPLLSGYVHKHQGDLEQARQDFTLALARDPNVVTAYVNRGYVLNDLHLPKDASDDFEEALKRDPSNGEAHLGLAYASLDLHRPQLALKESDLAQQVMGDSQPLHLIRATAYGQKGLLTKAAAEFRAALKFTPDDGSLHLALAGNLYTQRKFHQAIDELLIANKLSPDDAATYALLARAYAELHDRPQTLQYVQLAEQRADAGPPKPPAVDTFTGTAHAPIARAVDPRASASGIYLSTGAALSRLGEPAPAMERFKKALLLPGSDRVAVRLAIAGIMAQQDRADDARRQIALALMEGEAGDTLPATGEQLIGAADIFRELHDYELSKTYLLRAKAEGALDTSVHIGLANTYLAIGDTPRAQGELAAIKAEDGEEPGYQYLLAQANVYRQEHQGTQALTAFAQASNAAGEDQTAEQSLLQAGADEGLRIKPRVSLLSDFAVEPIFEDTTVYVLDSKLDGLTPVPIGDIAQLPPPRSSLETEGTVAYHLHLDHLPTASGFFQVRNARGLISVPSTNSIVNRNTTDYTLNFGLNPTLHLGTNVVQFDSGIQGTLRRDANTPIQLDQNLFRAFTYVSTSSFFNAVAASGSVLYETGPFTNINEHSQALAGNIDFRVGEPWGKTALVTGWGANDQKFSPIGFENYYTSSYIGFQRRFTGRLNVRAVAEDLRAWRIVGNHSAIAQSLRPSGTVKFAVTRNWNVQALTAYSSTRGFHVYDAVQNGFSVSYAVPVHRGYKDVDGDVPLQYPIRFSGGLQEESFFNFSGEHNQQLRPYFSISLF